MRVGGANADILFRDASLPRHAFLNAACEIPGESKHLERDNRRSFPCGFQHQRMGAQGLTNIRDHPSLSWWLVKTAKLDTFRRRDLSYAFARFEHSTPIVAPDRRGRKHRSGLKACPRRHGAIYCYELK
jgi:hypothetical protein